MREGIVVRAVSGVYSVHADGHVVHCSMRGNLKKEFQYSTTASHARRVTRAKRAWTHDTVSVGDHVRFSDTHHGAGVIEEVLPRHSRFTRAAFRGKEQTLVCNIDQLVAVFACVEPRVDPWKLDRFLAVAELEGIAPLIVANKVDLAGDECRAAFAEWEGVGYRVVYTSAKAGVGIDALRRELEGKVSAFAGPSGVGKSSLLNAIQPGLNLRTTDIGYVTYKGRHTTTAAQLIPLRTGGWVADTPGLRQLELIEADRNELAECFPEFVPHLGRCRFDDCRHQSEPGCGLKDAVEQGAVSRRRYESFLALAEEAESAGR